jgi:hypothetical protein
MMTVSSALVAIACVVCLPRRFDSVTANIDPDEVSMNRIAGAKLASIQAP